MEEGLLKVQMLGTFSIEYNGRVISFERNSQTKTKQLLQILVHAGARGIAREELLQNLFGKDEIRNPSNSLRATVFRLRKQLSAAGLPQDDYVKIEHGYYFWTDHIATSVDALDFEKLVKKAKETASEEKKRFFLEQACEKYKGEFMPLLTDEEWAIVWNVHYKNVYFSSLKELFELFRKQGQYDQILHHCIRAVALYPFDEWQLCQLDCLVKLGRKDEAIQVYENTSKMFFEELGITPSERMMEQFEQMCGQIQNSAGEIEAIQQKLDEKEDQDGAYYCSYPSFAESYRYIRRVIERTGQEAYLMLCTITDGKGNPLERGERLQVFAEELRGAIISSLRRGDLYTQYSPNQYLILLLELKKEDCRIVMKRINSHLEKAYRKNYLDYHVTPLSKVKESDGTIQFALKKRERMIL